MKKINKYLILGITFTTSLFSYNGYYAPYKEGTSQRVSQGYDGTTSHYGAGGAYALDFAGSFNIYAPKDGVVEHVGTDSYKIPFCVNNPQHWHGPANYIRVKHNDGVYSYYYHLNRVDVAKGDSIIRGKTILGVSGNTGCSTANHLHFQFAKKASMKRVNSLKISLEDIGIPYRGTHTSGNTPINNSTISLNAGIFDGAGSIISPDEQGAGKNFDIAKMHSHPGTGSTVVFQWLYDSSTCSQLNIRSEYDIGDVIIRSKVWDKHLTKKAIKVRLDEGMPITIKRPDDTKVWTTFAITTTKPLEFGNRIVAECKTSNDTFEQGNAVNVDTNLVDVTHDYFWTGTGSIISSASREFNPPYGMTADLAVTFKSNNSLTSFQWLKQENCKQLKISTNEGSAINSVHIKKWDVENWGESKCNSLPCTLSPATNEYYVIKVKSSANAISSGSLYAECIE